MSEAEVMPDNPSGIYPTGRRVLVHPQEIENVTQGGIVLPDSHLMPHQQAQSIGIFVEAGPDAWTHGHKEIWRVMNGELRHAETQVEGYSRPFAGPGDRVSFGKFAGQELLGEDGKKYRLLNDEDILCKVSDAVKFTDIEARQGLGR